MLAILLLVTSAALLLLLDNVTTYGYFDIALLIRDVARPLGVTLLGISAGVIALDWLNGHRSQALAAANARQQREEVKAKLIRQMGSQDNLQALRSIEELRKHGWLADGSLRNADLRSARLRGADLQEANLMGANLWNADLTEANLLRVNLQSANLQGAQLRKSILFGANLRGANLQETNLRGAGLWSASLDHATLWNADMEGATLRQANLQGANLFGANLRGVVLFRVHYTPTTTLPNGKAWTPDTHMSQFTYTDHANFWRSNHPDSPAYGG
jgi:hypothetical protein